MSKSKSVAAPAAPRASPPAPQERLWARIVFGGLLAWTFLTLCYPLRDTDFWWHLKTGEWILEHGAPPQVDVYTFTDFDKPWIDLHWGFQLLIAGVYHLGGANLVILFKAAVITGAVAVAWLAGGKTLPAWLKTLLWVPAVVCISGRGYERPEMLTQLFLAAWLWVALRVAERPRLIWLLPVIQLVWVNCHALFVLGLVVGAAYVIDCVAREFAGGKWGLAPADSQPSAKSIIRAGALVAAVCFVNPYFEDGVLFPLELYRKFTVDQEFWKDIGEFRPPLQYILKFGWRGLFNIYMMSEIIVWLIAAGSFVWLAWRRRRWSVMRVLLFAGFSHLAWKATRNSNIFAIMSLVVACENFAEAARAPAAALPEPRALIRYSRGMAAVLTALIVAVVTGGWAAIAEEGKEFRLGESPHWFIHEAAEFAGQPGFPNRAFVANNGQAAVYTYHNAPQRFVFTDARLEVCSKETFQQYNKILAAMWVGDLAWEKVLEAYSGGEMPVVILDSRGETSRMAMSGLLQTPGWRLVFADKTAGVFLTDAQADQLKLPKVDFASLINPDNRPLAPPDPRMHPAFPPPGSASPAPDRQTQSPQGESK
ncbi:MAG: hypothetical protein HY290_26695 [Planctomycetia bacterium]|nr:hypothetical protein [Planctomycetia bacterium]